MEWSESEEATCFCILKLCDYIGLVFGDPYFHNMQLVVLLNGLIFIWTSCAKKDESLSLQPFNFQTIDCRFKPR